MEMTTPRFTLIAACIAALFGAAQARAQAPATSDAGIENQQMHRIGERSGGFAGSLANLQSLRTGLRRGSEITLTDRTSSVTFTPPTRPMGYGNIRHALDLASRELARAGIARPTPQQIEAAMMGGTVSSPRGDIALPGVLVLRSQGMGWGRIAHAIGVHPSAHSHLATGIRHGHDSGHAAFHAAPRLTGIHHGHDSSHAAFHAAPPPSGITTAISSASAAPGTLVKAHRDHVSRPHAPLATPRVLNLPPNPARVGAPSRS